MKKISDFNSATEKYPVVYAGSATRPEFVDMPTVLQQQEGIAPMDTLPAQWWNAMWKLATKDINAFRDYVGDSITEINNLLTKFNITLDDADSEQLYDFFHDDYVQNYLSTVFISKNGGTIDGDLHIKGDLSVDGIGEEIISTELKVGANTITLRNDNPTSLGNTELAGVVTENYDGNNHNNIIAINKNGEARTGDIDIATRILYSNNGTNFYTDEDLTTPATIGATEEVRDTGNQTSGGVEIYEGITYSNDDTEPLLTRDEAADMTNGAYLQWDGVNKKAVTAPNIGAQVITIVANSKTFTGTALNSGVTLSILFTADITSSTAEGLTVNYNGEDIPVKIYKNNGLYAFYPVCNQYYIQAYTRVEFLYDGTQFIIIGNPIVYRTNRVSVRADKSVDGGSIGDVKAIAVDMPPYGWLVCDGREVGRGVYPELFALFSAESVLSVYGVGDGSTTFNLPDYREVALVGVGENDTDTIATHDVYTEGEFKDDALQGHYHKATVRSYVSSSSSGSRGLDELHGTYSDANISVTDPKSDGKHGTPRIESVTRGKRKGVTYIIKAF